MTSENPWTLYWQSGNLYSCIASQDAKDQAYIDEFWAEFANGMAQGAQLLDLASGNGAVPVALLAANTSLSISAVDLADIAPERLAEKFDTLGEVQFFPETDICDLPFDDARFDGVTSQFGLEYAPQSAALREAARVLKPGAPMRLLLHHNESGIVRPAETVIAEIEALTRPDGLIEHLKRFVREQGELRDLEAAGRDYLDNPAGKSKHISGQIMAGISRVIDDRKSFPERALALASGMEQRLVAESVRLSQLRSAALDEASASLLQMAAIEAGFGSVSIDEQFVGDQDPALVGWALHALRL